MSDSHAFKVAVPFDKKLSQLKNGNIFLILSWKLCCDAHEM